MTDIQGAIIDVDGTLLDSMPIWDSIAIDYLKSKGVRPRHDLNERLRELGGHEIPDYFRKNYGIKDSPKNIHAGMNRLLEEFYFNTAPVKSGVVSFLEKLKTHGTKMCVATATDRHLIEPALKRCGLYRYFEHIFTCGDEKTSKNKPDIYLRAADFLGTDISKTLVIEDALYAVKSAKCAGFIVVGVHDLTEDDQQDEMRALCDHYYISLEEFSFEDY